MRAFVHYALAAVALTLFGCEVCPLIQGLGHRAFGFVIVACFTVAFALRAPLQKVLVDGAPPLARVTRQLVLDLSLMTAAGAGVMFVNLIAFGFYLGSGVRVVIGAATFGLFAALDTALARERAVAVEAERHPLVDDMPAFFSLTVRFAAFALGLLVLVTADLTLLAARDLAELRDGGAAATSTAEVVQESAIALVFFFALAVTVILSYARNLRLFLAHQQLALDQVAAGRLDVRVPIASRDEFAMIAVHTNRMIDGLRDRERVRDLVNKLASPAVAERLLSSKDGLKLGGARCQVAVLFADVRDFTTRSEQHAPERIVADLNLYFTRMVEVVHQNGGVVDKFIGDGIMAIFGLEHPARAVDDAIEAACAMQREVAALNATLSAPLAIGVGVHVGDVIAGLIGSPQRLEFTFIGDAVNTAARIESMTKEVGAKILVSADARARATTKTAQFTDVGAHKVKGKAEPVALFAVATGAP